MSNQLRHLIQTGIQLGFFQARASLSDRAPWIVQSGPLTSNLLYHFRHEWIKSFIRQSSGYSNFLWYDSNEPSAPSSSSEHLSVAWQSPCPSSTVQSFPLIFDDQHQCLRLRYFNPREEITMLRLSDERRRFWKKFLSERQLLEFLSSKEHQFSISYRVSSDHPIYPLETIKKRRDSTYELICYLNQTLITLLIDSKMEGLHPSLTAYQIGLESDVKSKEIALYLAKILTLKHQLRLRHDNGQIKQDQTIPFRLILNEKLSKQGLCALWNRDTHLSEEIHLKLVCQRLSDYFGGLDDAL